jgi:hypothetical protein
MAKYTNSKLVECDLEGEEEGIEILWLIGSRNEHKRDDILNSHVFSHWLPIIDENDWPCRCFPTAGPFEALESIGHHPKWNVARVLEVNVILLLTINDDLFA